MDQAGIALIFGKFIDMYHELRSLDADTAKLTGRCCDPRRVIVLRALASLEADLLPFARGLEQVAQPVFGGDEVRPSQAWRWYAYPIRDYTLCIPYKQIAVH